VRKNIVYIHSYLKECL